MPKLTVSDAVVFGIEMSCSISPLDLHLIAITLSGIPRRSTESSSLSYYLYTFCNARSRIMASF